MIEGSSPATSGQWIQGDRNIQISNVYGAQIEVTLNERSWHVPLEPATAPVGARVASPARLVRARSGVLPYVDRAGHLDALSAWLGTPAPFAVCLIGGRGGTGKTRLGVELCERTAAEAGWLSGLLTRSADPAGIRDLHDIPNPRLVVIDYAETCVEQLEAVLPALQRTAKEQYPVRVLLLVRSAPQQGSDWRDALRGGSDWLESVLDDATVRVLDDSDPTLGERADLFNAAAAAFAGRADPPPALAEVTVPDLAGEPFSNPLFIVIVAYLAVHGRQDLPATRSGLLGGLAKHEDKYWLGRSDGLNISEVLRRRIVALATLAGATDETEAALMLRHLPELSDGSGERRHELARWVHALYPGPQWWNPLEPDLLGEYLVSTELGGFPGVLAAVLEWEHPERVVQPLDTFARAAAYDQTFAEAVRPVLSAHLERLCVTAAEQAAAGRDTGRIFGSATVARALERAASAISPDPLVLTAAVAGLPSRPSVLLNGLVLTLTGQLVVHYKNLAASDPDGSEPLLASSLYNLAVRLFDAGRQGEALSTVLEAETIYRKLDSFQPGTYTSGLARALDLLSNCTAAVGRRTGALSSLNDAVSLCTDAVLLYRELTRADPAAYRGDLVTALNNLSNHLSDVGRTGEAVDVLREAVSAGRELVAGDPRAIHRSTLAMTLSNLSTSVAETGAPAHGEALRAVKEAILLYRVLVKEDLPSYGLDYAIALNNLSNRLSEIGDPDQAVQPAEEAVTIFRELALLNPAAYEFHLAGTLVNLSRRWDAVGRRSDARATAQEAVTKFWALAEEHPLLHQPNVQKALKNLSALSSDR